MFIGFSAYLFFTIFCAVFFFLAKKNHLGFAKVILVSYSCILIFTFNPAALFLCLGITFYSYLIFLFVEKTKINRYFNLLIFLPLIGFNIMEFERVVDNFLLSFGGAERNPVIVLASSLGLSYYSLRLYVSAMQSTNRKFSGWFNAATFAPSFQSGPIYSANYLDEAVVNSRITAEILLEAVYRIVLALLFIYLLTEVALELFSSVFSTHEFRVQSAVDNSISLSNFLTLSLYSFLKLFLNFAGFTHLAVGFGLLFGIKLPENFNKPYLATDLRDFWRRWHTSLGSVISNYIFNPLVRRIGKPSVSIIVTFALVGLWHEVSVSYFIWGLLHGALIALSLKGIGLDKIASKLHDNRLGLCMLVSVKWFLTMSFVSTVSLYANNPEILWSITLS